MTTMMPTTASTSPRYNVDKIREVLARPGPYCDCDRPNCRQERAAQAAEESGAQHDDRCGDMCTATCAWAEARRLALQLNVPRSKPAGHVAFAVGVERTKEGWRAEFRDCIVTGESMGDALGRLAQVLKRREAAAGRDHV